ncbi:MAG: threonylcarbamoyl-AMP synthase [Hyphomicrobiales bacterium]|nr:threonylcarbamoyl-AMP synthase [Hyphomicrobiales bacterium]MDE2115621.1 threonylcarbamoyl-AMP synthase [Hyphomicrobiales bacterium]
MQTLATKIHADNAAGIAMAAAIIQADGIVAFPTETVYGLGANARSPRAVAKIYEAKGRPTFNPLIAHVSGIEEAFQYGEFSNQARWIAERFWPGPLTLIVPAREGICELARAGLDSVGLRVPASATARALIKASGCPLAAPSANRSGHVSPVTAAHVLADLDGRIDMVLEGGASTVGVESTILSMLETVPRLLRAGGTTLEALEAQLGVRIATGPHAGESIIAPGQLTSHYAPQASIRLDATALERDEIGLDFAGQLAKSAKMGHRIMDLSPQGDLTEAAANLFSYLRALDEAKRQIAVAPIPHYGLGAAINDRLHRAAAKR